MTHFFGYRLLVYTVTATIALIARYRLNLFIVTTLAYRRPFYLI
ncbi:hypothetical protein QN382_17510 [Pseudomonas sp. 10B1]|nr:MULTISPECIES: hypothetical protein [unclassified Pseudomonas]MDY7560463.1 hypothetical protein [Pseudomonas sp. AB6]MEA9975943.1 hypothetical protein [Pseudomonas sp. RTS4]MEA9993220.1 hypothetical protein [Pseudomonas sp. AA4]MEB0088044.1 hypothetical protein [Pseudomonas sp. RTI1]MEB0124293.1 hypothetical protein [Pseudomonas sp. CCC1.2]